MVYWSQQTYSIFCHQVSNMKCILLWILTLHTFTTIATIKVISQDSLADFKWRHRLLITQVDTENELRQLREQIYYHSSDFSNRKLSMLVRIKDKTWIVNISTIQIASPLLSAEVLNIISQNLNKVLLIGLDGSIKHRYPTPTFSLQQVFNHIDLMPMRRGELVTK
jgi:hypothetical protein